MADGDRLSLEARVAIGSIAGIVATLALTSTVRRLSPRGAAPSDPGLLTLLAPFALGAAGGALLAAARDRPGRLSGLAARAGLWLAGEAGLLPRVTIGPVSARPARRSIALLAGHLAWGWSVAEAMREIGGGARGQGRFRSN